MQQNLFKEFIENGDIVVMCLKYAPIRLDLHLKFRDVGKNIE